jgi:hypothetical protein
MRLKRWLGASMELSAQLIKVSGRCISEGGTPRRTER